MINLQHDFNLGSSVTDASPNRINTSKLLLCSQKKERKKKKNSLNQRASSTGGAFLTLASHSSTFHPVQARLPSNAERCISRLLYTQRIKSE